MLDLRDEFLACHQDQINVFLHVFTGLIGVGGGLGILHACTKRQTGSLATMTFLYIVALLSSATPLPLVLAVAASLFAVVLPLIKMLDLGVLGSLAAVVMGYIGQDAAHYVAGEKTFQSTYSDDGVLSMSAVTLATWVTTFSRHTFFLLPLTADAAARVLLPPGSTARSFLLEEGGSGLLGQPEAAWVVAVRENAWILATIALWVAGCYALDSDCGPFPWMLRKRRVLGVNLETAALRSDLAAIRKWAVSGEPSRETTTHWWFSDLAGGEKGEAAAFTRVSECSQIDAMFREKFSRDGYAVEPICGMNEVYVSGPAKSGSSDTVFTTRHTDGPWALLPFCSTYRCILGLDSSAVYTTVFPNVPRLTTTCRVGDIVCFDYNREVHYIEEYAGAKEEQSTLAPQDGGDGYRIVLKLHYCVYPRVLWPLGKLAAALSTGYNILFRNLFLFTLTPTSTPSRVMAFLVVKVTILYRMAIETGLHNLLYVLALFVAGRLVHPVVFLAGTSFVHYPRYITTYYHRGRDVDFGAFKSDALYFKAVALSHIGFRYASALLSTFGSGAATAAVAAVVGGGGSGGGGGVAHSNANASTPFGTAAGGDDDAATATIAMAVLSLAMIVAGSAVSILATRALGVDGTYFGSELGVCEMKWVTAFPYGTVPHPMIVGQLMAFLGVHLLPAFRAAWPWLMPAHCACYLVVLLQEHFDVHAKAAESGRVAGYYGGGEAKGAAAAAKKVQ